MWYKSFIKSENNSEYLVKKYYNVANIIWDNTLGYKIRHGRSYPSEYFVDMILNLVLINNIIINPPIIVHSNDFSRIRYIKLHYNKLLILDALMKQGSQTRYLLETDNGTDRYIYSEHSGVITIKNNLIDILLFLQKQIEQMVQILIFIYPLIVKY